MMQNIVVVSGAFEFLGNESKKTKKRKILIRMMTVFGV